MKFTELSERAKEKARDWYREGSMDTDWWECIYEDAKRIGVSIISSFDCGRREIELAFSNTARDVARSILEQHGKECSTMRSALDYIRKVFTARSMIHSDDALAEALADIEIDFRRDLEWDYLGILQNEYEYQMSDEVIDEGIRCNDYDFNEDGTCADVRGRPGLGKPETTC